MMADVWSVSSGKGCHFVESRILDAYHSALPGMRSCMEGAYDFCQSNKTYNFERR